jgi:hypothetical protein
VSTSVLDQPASAVRERRKARLHSGQPIGKRGVLTTRREPVLGRRNPEVVGDVVKTTYEIEPGLALLESIGVAVVAMTGSPFREAVGLARRLKEAAHPLDLIAIALPMDVPVPPTAVNQLAALGIVILRSIGESAVETATCYIAELKAAHERGTDNLRKFTQAVQGRANNVKR